MENYVLLNDRDTECDIPFPDELSTSLRFELKKNTKLGNVIPRMIKELKKEGVRRVILFGTGENSAKCVACVEVLKSKLKDFPLYQWTEVRSSQSTDVWAPAADERLDRIVVEKFVPKVFILVSRDSFPEHHRCLGQQSTSEMFPSFLNRASRAALQLNDHPAVSKRRDNQWRRAPKQKRQRDAKTSVTSVPTIEDNPVNNMT